MSDRPQPKCVTLPGWLRANLGRTALAPLTGTDSRCLAAAVMIVEAYAYDSTPELATAFGLVVGRMQRSTQGLAFHAVAHVLDWSDRAKVWQRAGLETNCRQQVHLRYGLSPMPLPKGINNPAVRAKWIASRRGKVQAFDRLVDAGATTAAAARQIGVSRSGVKCMRRSIENLKDGHRTGRGLGTHIDLGLALLSCLIKPGERLTSEDIAAWCGCSRSAIHALEQRAMRTLRQRLVESVLEPDLAEELQTLLARTHQPN